MHAPRSLSCAAVLFDLDGVLVDSTGCVETTWRAWALRHALDPDIVLPRVHGRRAQETVRAFVPHADVERELADLVARESTETAGIREVPGAAELLRRLPAERWGIATSGVRSVAEHRLRVVGLPIPRVLVCADEVERGKPDPEGYLAAAHGLGLEPAACIVVEDAPAGLAAARAAGMRAIGIASTHEPAALAEADIVVSALQDLAARVRDDGAIVLTRRAATRRIGDHDHGDHS